ncbi:MAG: SDR family oxidoreductase [Actinomycetota bacterium]
MSTRPEVALVTGAAGDIGRAVAVRLAAAGVAVALADRAAAGERLVETEQRCREAGQQETAVATFDVTEPDEVTTAIDQLASSFGVPQLLVNNAGLQGRFANVADAPLDDVARVLAVNVTGAFAVLQAFARTLRASGRPGAIVNVASMAGVSGAPNMAAYSASKAAVIALTKSAAKDLAADAIRVNAVSPGFIGPGVMWDNQVRSQAEVASQYFLDSTAEVADQMIGSIPLRRYGGLDEVASVVEFLLSDAASYLTGINIEVSGGAA